MEVCWDRSAFGANLRWLIDEMQFLALQHWLLSSSSFFFLSQRMPLGSISVDLKQCSIALVSSDWFLNLKTESPAPWKYVRVEAVSQWTIQTVMRAYYGVTVHHINCYS